MKIEEARKHILDWIKFATNPDTRPFIDEPCTDEELLEAMRVAVEAMSPSSTTTLTEYQIADAFKAAAMKGLPRWKTIKKDDNAIARIPHVGTNMLGERMLYIGENAISISCLMKLPGFKEDSHE